MSTRTPSHQDVNMSDSLGQDLVHSTSSITEEDRLSKIHIPMYASSEDFKLFTRSVFKDINPGPAKLIFDFACPVH